MPTCQPGVAFSLPPPDPPFLFRGLSLRERRFDARVRERGNWMDSAMQRQVGAITDWYMKTRVPQPLVSRKAIFQLVKRVLESGRSEDVTKQALLGAMAPTLPSLEYELSKLERHSRAIPNTPGAVLPRPRETYVPLPPSTSEMISSGRQGIAAARKRLLGG